MNMNQHTHNITPMIIIGKNSTNHSPQTQSQQSDKQGTINDLYDQKQETNLL